MTTATKKIIGDFEYPDNCGRCERPIDKNEWLDKLCNWSGMKRKGKGFKCPDCENEMTLMWMEL